MSNALGTITPVREIVRRAKDAGAKVLIDGSQAVVHIRVDVQALDCDFYVFTGHKLYGPSGIGVLYGREELLDDMPSTEERPVWQAGVSTCRYRWSPDN